MPSAHDLPVANRDALRRDESLEKHVRLPTPTKSQSRGSKMPTKRARLQERKHRHQRGPPSKPKPYPRRQQNHHHDCNKRQTRKQPTGHQPPCSQNDANPCRIRETVPVSILVSRNPSSLFKRPKCPPLLHDAAVRWLGILEVASGAAPEDSPISLPEAQIGRDILLPAPQTCSRALRSSSFTGAKQPTSRVQKTGQLRSTCCPVWGEHIRLRLGRYLLFHQWRPILQHPTISAAIDLNSKSTMIEKITID